VRLKKEYSSRVERGVDHPILSRAEAKERVELEKINKIKTRAIPLPPLWAFVACYRLNFAGTSSAANCQFLSDLITA
jgi:hypothetical protein